MDNEDLDAIANDVMAMLAETPGVPKLAPGDPRSEDIRRVLRGFAETMSRLPDAEAVAARLLPLPPLPPFETVSEFPPLSVTTTSKAHVDPAILRKQATIRMLLLLIAIHLILIKEQPEIAGKIDLFVGAGMISWQAAKVVGQQVEKRARERD